MRRSMSGSSQMKALPEISLTKQSQAANEKDIAVCAWLEQVNTDFAFLGDDGTETGMHPGTLKR